MRRLLLSLPLLLLALAPFPAAGQDAFLSGTEDLPLMPGLTEDPDAAMVFESPQGRVLEAEARGDLGLAAVRAFYADTLPQLGWTPAGDDRFTRAGEQLRLEYTAGPPLAVHFFLAPAP